MVTSFRPRSSLLKDDTVLTTVRPVSSLGELYHQFAAYRFDILQDRLHNAKKSMHDWKRANRQSDTVCLERFIREQIVFLQYMDKEIVEDEKVEKGVIGGGHSVSSTFMLRKHFIPDPMRLIVQLFF